MKNYFEPVLEFLELSFKDVLAVSQNDTLEPWEDGWNRE